MDEYFRIIITIILVAPMAYTDLRERTAYRDAMIVIVCVGLALAIHVVMENDYTLPPAVLTGYVFGGILAIAFGVLGRFGLVGSADVFVVWGVILMNPSIGDIPVGALSILLGMIGCVVYFVGVNISRNISDILHNKKYVTNIIASHHKRKGDKFRIPAGTNPRIQGVANNSIVGEDGSEIFIPVEESGQEVTKGIPMVSIICVSVGIVLAYAMILPGTTFANVVT